MDQKKWLNVKYLFSTALEQPASTLGTFLDQACGDDAELRGEVSRLLFEHFNAGSFLEQPVHVAQTDTSVSTGALGPPSKQEFSAGSRFEIRKPLGAGGFGKVYEAFDRERHSLVALKYLQQPVPEHLYRLKREFRTLVNIQHENLIHVHDLFSNNSPPFFTMELLKGRDFGQYLRETPVPGISTNPEKAYAELRGHLMQLARGVLALHDAQLVHRDIKPSNVFLTQEGRLVLLDLGLVKQLDSQMSSSMLTLAGTPHYLAPEQLDGEEVTPATDWYSIGVLLFEALTGKRPFEGPVLDVLSRKQQEEAQPPSVHIPDIPPDLDALCRALLQRDPPTRPGSSDVLRCLQTGPIVIALEEHTVRSPASRIFVGRDPDLAALHTAFDEAEAGHTICVHVRGESGVGKTGVIREFLDRIRRATPGCAVLSGRCYESEAAPHKGLDELVDHLALFLKTLDPQQTKQLLPRYFGLLTRLFPVLQQFHPQRRTVADIVDPREQRHRAFSSLRECLVRISESRPLILWIDDLHWCDFDTVRFLNDLVQSDPFNCLILLSYRDADLDTNPVLTALDRTERPANGCASVRTLTMRNLFYREAHDLALAQLLEKDPAEAWETVASKIAQESRGNPFFVTILVHYALALSGRRDLSASAFGIGHVIKRRIGLLPEAAIRLLELVAVAGQPLHIDICVAAAHVGERFLEFKSLLGREHLLRTNISNAGEELDIYHDQVREAITRYLSPEAIRIYHELIAQALEGAQSTDHERLGVHFEAAGDRVRAVKYTMLAAESALEALAFDRASRLFKRTLDLIDEDAQDRGRICERLGDALSNAGRGREAAEAYLLASRMAHPLWALELQRRACEQYLRSGHLKEGAVLIDSLLRDADIWYPKRRWAVIGSLLWHRFLLRMAMMRPFPTPVPRSLTPGEHMKLDVSWTGAVGMSMADLVRGADFQARYTLLALRGGDPSRMALGLAAELAMGRIDGGRSRQETQRLFTTALDLATRAQNPHAIAFTHSMMGAASWITGDWADCYERNRSAATIFREQCSGVGWELTTANTFALSALIFLGRWREHALTFPELIQQAESRGDRYGAISLPLLAYTYVHSLAADRPVEARILIAKAISEWPSQDFQVQRCDALFGQVETHLYEHNAQAAFDAIQRDWIGLKRSQLLNIQFYRILMKVLQGRVELALALRENEPQSHRQLRKAGRFARALMHEKSRWAIAMGCLLHAGIASAENRSVDARRFLQNAERLFIETQMDHYTAVTRLRLSQLAESHEARPDQASLWFEHQNVVNVARFADLLAPGMWATANQSLSQTDGGLPPTVNNSETIGGTSFIRIRNL